MHTQEIAARSHEPTLACGRQVTEPAERRAARQRGGGALQTLGPLVSALAVLLLFVPQAARGEIDFGGRIRELLDDTHSNPDVVCSRYVFNLGSFACTVVAVEDVGGGLGRLVSRDVSAGGSLGAVTVRGTTLLSLGLSPAATYAVEFQSQTVRQLFGVTSGLGKTVVIDEANRETQLDAGPGLESAVSLGSSDEVNMIVYDDFVDPTGASGDGVLVLHLLPYNEVDGVDVSAPQRVNDYLSATVDNGRVWGIRNSFRGPSSPSFVTAWESYGSPGNDDQESSIQARIFDETGTAVAPQFQVNTLTPGFQLEADVAGASDGSSFLVVWASEGSVGGDSSFTSIQGRLFFTDGTPAGDQFQVNQLGPGYQVEPSIAVLESGEYVVVWAHLDTSSGTWNVTGRSVSAAGVPLGEDFDVSDGNAAADPEPKVAAFGEEVVVVWSGPDALLMRGTFGLLFQDGFESGDTSSWSAASP